MDIDRDADANAAWQAYKEREWHGWDSLQPDLREAFLAGWVARPVRPVEGVTEPDIDLLHDSAATCQRHGLDGTARRLHALAARLAQDPGRDLGGRSSA